MPRLVTPFSNPHVHASHTLQTPYRRESRRSEKSPSVLSSSDKENTTPTQMDSNHVPSASQAAFRQKLANTTGMHYDPNQPREVVRHVTGEYRRLLKETHDHRAEYLKPGNDGIHETVEKADILFETEVRTTTVANLDSKLLVNSSELAKYKARNMKLGDAGFNVDEYVQKLVTYMGGRGNSRARDEEEHLNWYKLGRVAMGICRRPPTMDFMLGPLSVEKKVRNVVRKQTERRDAVELVRPDQLIESDIQKQENATSRMVRSVHECLRDHSPINLFEFVINPRSFGQTVENFFYLSFSIRDARARVDIDEDGMPIVSTVSDDLTEEEIKMENKQCVLEFTMSHWEDLKRALNITESIIPHREYDEENVAADGKSWY